MKNIESNSERKENKESISRKEAIKKTGKYATLAAVSMMAILSPKESQAQSEAPTPGW